MKEDISQEWNRVNRAINSFASESNDDVYQMMELEMAVLNGIEDALLRFGDKAVDQAIISGAEKAESQRWSVQLEINQLERDVKVLRDVLSSKEYHNQSIDNRIAGLEKQIKYTKFWEFGKRAGLEKELEKVKAEPREDITELKGMIDKADRKLSSLYKSFHEAQRKEEYFKKELEKIKVYKAHDKAFKPKKGR